MCRLSLLALAFVGLLTDLSTLGVRLNEAEIIHKVMNSSYMDDSLAVKYVLFN